MEPQSSKEPVLHLPQPISEQPPLGMQPERMAVPEFALNPGQAAPATLPMIQPQTVQQTQLPQALPQAIPANPSVQSSTAVTTQPSDEEIDRMWVSKAKKIVEQTHADPFLESHEIGKTKVEYLKVRYHKEVKAAEGKS